jgi:hypothetical protein
MREEMKEWKLESDRVGDWMGRRWRRRKRRKQTTIKSNQFAAADDRAALDEADL